MNNKHFDRRDSAVAYRVLAFLGSPLLLVLGAGAVLAV